VEAPLRGDGAAVGCAGGLADDAGPYDYDELIGAIAPRPVYIVSAQLDRDATPADVRGAVEGARKVYGLYDAGEKLKLDEPWDYNRLSTETQNRIVAWMKENMK
jgi:hypothetical protein